MPKLRLTNRQGGWEVLSGLVGGPLVLLFIIWMWMSGNMAELTGWKWIAMVLATVASPIWLIYGAYRAIVVATLWLEFSTASVGVKKLLGLKTYSANEISGLRFDNRPITMSSDDTGIHINVGQARFVTVHGSDGKSLGEVRVTPADRSRLVRYLQDHGGRQWLPQ